MLPNSEDRQKFLSTSSSVSIRSYFNNLHQLALKDNSYTTVYKQDYDFYNNLQQKGGVDPLLVTGISSSLLTTGLLGTYAYKKYNTHEEPTCYNIMGNNDNLCQELRTKLKYISQTLQDNLCKTELSGKVKKAIKLFIDDNVCCDAIYNDELMRDVYVDYVILIIKLIKRSKSMLLFATNYVYELYVNNTDLFDMHYMKDYKNFYNAKTMTDKKVAFDQLNKHFASKSDGGIHGKKINIGSALRTAFFMRFIKEDSKKLQLFLSGDPYISLTKP